jgi:Sulfotransferase family
MLVRRPIRLTGIVDEDRGGSARIAEPAPMPIIVGVPRSGTTLLRLMLDSHPALAIPPETGFMAGRLHWLKHIAPREALFRTVTKLPFRSGTWRDFGLDADEFREQLRRIVPFDWGEGFRTFYRLYAKQQNKPRYGDKTPLYCQHTKAIESVLPEVHFVHIIRDGRDVALSLRKTSFAPAQDIPTLARYWQRLVQNARQEGQRCRAYAELRYEDLVNDPPGVLRSICDFLKLDFDPAMLQYWERSVERLREHKPQCRIDGSVRVTREQRLFQQRLILEVPHAERVFCWKKEMTLQERAQFAQFAGATLEDLGYES